MIKSKTRKTKKTETSEEVTAPEVETVKAESKTEEKAPETDSNADESTPESKPEAAQKPAPQRTDISFSGNLYGFLASRNISLSFTSYQTGNLYIL